MSNKVMSKFIHLSELAMKVNTYTEHDVFIEFSGHVNHMSIHYNKNGYKPGKGDRINLLDIYADNESEKYMLKILDAVEKKLIDLM